MMCPTCGYNSDDDAAAMGDAMIERVARAICKHFGAGEPDMTVSGQPYWHVYRDAARAAIVATNLVQTEKTD